jgi:aspartate aminotransferase-like enzyme
VEWGEAVNPDDIAKALDDNKDVKAVYTTLCETSTATLTDIKAVGAVVKDTGAVLVVDAISALGGDELRADDWHVDCVIAGSQKGLMLPPGLSFISVSGKAREAMARSTLPKYYFSIERALDSYEKDDTPWTPAVSLVVGLGETLRTIREEGIDNVFARHARLAMATRAGMTGMGLKIFSKSPANIVTSVKMPTGVDGLKVLSSLRDDLKLTPAGGQAKLKGKIIRIAHLGYVDEFDVVTAVSALELALLRNGATIAPGSGVAAVQKAFAGV